MLALKCMRQFAGLEIILLQILTLFRNFEACLSQRITPCDVSSLLRLPWKNYGSCAKCGCALRSAVAVYTQGLVCGTYTVFFHCNLWNELTPHDKHTGWPISSWILVGLTSEGMFHRPLGCTAAVVLPKQDSGTPQIQVNPTQSARRWVTQ